MIMRFILFLTVFLSIYGGMHWYVLARLASFWSLPRGGWFYVLFAFSMLSYVAGHMFSARFPGFIADILYTAASVWMGIIFLLWCALLVYEVIRLFTAIDTREAGIFIVAAVGIVSVYAIINALFFNVKTIDLESTKVKQEYTIVQLTDMHCGSPHRPGYVRDVVNRVNEINPDIVCITGDLFDKQSFSKPECLRPLSDIKAPVCFSPGNHEMYFGYSNVEELIKDLDIFFLRNQTIVFEDLEIMGMDYSQDKENLKKVLPAMKISKNKFSVMLYHNPIHLAPAVQHGVDLILSGHLHAGQIFPFNLFERLFYRYVCGLHRLNGTILYVSPGTSTWGPPMRFGSQNEITVFKILRMSVCQVMC